MKTINLVNFFDFASKSLSILHFSGQCCSKLNVKIAQENALLSLRCSSLPHDMDLARDLRISYIVLEDFKDASERRAQLKYQYFFHCLCTRCSAEDLAHKITDL